MLRILWIIAAALVIQGCGSPAETADKLDKMEWVLGYWEMSTPEGKVAESWVRTSDTVFAGVGKYSDSTGKMLTSEEISIVLRDGKLLYIPTVANQNGGQPVVFSEQTFSDSLVVFENMGHDFPQRIVYVRQADNKMLAYIEGEMNGEQMKLEYPYTKH